MLFGAVERLHSIGLRACHFVNNLSPAVSVMGKTKSFIELFILRSTNKDFS